MKTLYIVRHAKSSWEYEGIKDINAKYAAMIEGMDIYIGQLLDYLDKSGQRDKTMVLFCSDNGGINKISDQALYRAGKGSYYEGGVRGPMIVSWPGKVKPGTTSAQLTSLTDVMATVAASWTPRLKLVCVGLCCKDGGE